MKYPTRLALVVGLLIVVGAAQPAFATCALARLMESSYIYTPGAVYTYAESGNTVTDQLEGSWWALGFGDPASPGGNDSGTFPALEWMGNLFDLGYAAYITTTWAADARIDGCIDATPATCVAVQLTDVNPENGEPVFALLSAEQDALRNYRNLGLGSRIELAPLPRINITGSSRVSETGIALEMGALDPAAFDDNLYLDPNCTGASGGGAGIELFIPGVRWLTQTLPRGAQPPTDLNIFTGGWVDTGVDSLFGSPATLNSQCSSDIEVYITYALLNESGTPVSHTSGISTRLECGPNIADPIQRIRVQPPNREARPTRRR